MPHSISHPPALEGRTLLDELNHRIKNELASVINLVSFKAVWTGQRRRQGRAEQCRRPASPACRGPQHSDHAGPRRARRRRRTASQAWPGDEPMQAGPHEHPPSVVGRHVAAGIGAVLAPGAGHLRAGDERSPSCLLRRPRRRNQDQADACGFLGELPGHRQRIGPRKDQAWSRPADRRRTGRKPGRPAWVTPSARTSTSFVLDFPLTQREQHANRAVAARRPRTRSSIEGHAALPSRASRRRAGKSPHRCSPNSRSEGYRQCRERLFSPCPRACCSAPPSPRPMPHSRNSALLRVLRLLAGPPPGLGAGGPPPGLGAGGPPLGGPPAGPVAGLPPRGPAGAPPRDIAGGPPRLDGAAGLRGLDRGGQANFRGVEGRAAAYSANSYTRNSYARLWPWLPVLALCARLRLTPMAGPMPPPTTAATTCLHTGDTAPDAFWSVMETD